MELNRASSPNSDRLIANRSFHSVATTLIIRQSRGAALQAETVRSLSLVVQQISAVLVTEACHHCLRRSILGHAPLLPVRVSSSLISTLLHQHRRSRCRPSVEQISPQVASSQSGFSHLLQATPSLMPPLGQISTPTRDRQDAELHEPDHRRQSATVLSHQCPVSWQLSDE